LQAQLSLHTEAGIKSYEKVLRHFEDQNQNNAIRQSSVLILFYEKNGTTYLPLIKRHEYEGAHSGQISLPGGKVEPTDVDEFETALRETEEEIGINRKDIHLLGKLSPVYIAPSRFWVQVILGYHRNTPSFLPDAHEVASIIEFPLHQLKDKTSIEERKVIRTPEFSMNAPGYAYKEHFIWGATAMMLTELNFLLTRQ
jgi:8-oxo-dGTP pyrophosphatase MutT (NUDIX family)